MTTPDKSTPLKSAGCGSDVLKKPAGPYPLSKNENFIALIQSASDDEMIRCKIVAIARLDSFNRESMLNNLLSTLMQKGAPKELISALGCLKDDEVAVKVLEILG